MRQRRSFLSGSHTIASAFVFLQLGLFALLSTMLILLGVQGYRTEAARSESHNRYRILSSYIRSMVRSQDDAGSVEAEKEDMLAISYDYEGTRYVTRIYVHDGMLREWFSDEDYPFRPEDGDEICEAAGLHVVIRDGLLHVQVEDVDGEMVETDIAIRGNVQPEGDGGAEDEKS